MKMLKYITLLTVTFTFAVLLSAQDQSLPANRYTSKAKDWTVTNLFIEMGLNQSAFLNDVFGANRESGKIKPAIGYGLSGRYIYKSFFVEGGVFYAQFNGEGIKADLGLPADYHFVHRGVEGSVNVILFPSVFNAGFLKPYLGAGYQNAEMAITTTESFSIGKDIYSSFKTDGIFLQTGILILPVKNISLNICYKRSLDSFSENQGNTRTMIGLAYSFNLNNQH